MQSTTSPSLSPFLLSVSQNEQFPFENNLLVSLNKDRKTKRNTSSDRYKVVYFDNPSEGSDFQSSCWQLDK